MEKARVAFPCVGCCRDEVPLSNAVNPHLLMWSCSLLNRAGAWAEMNTRKQGVAVKQIVGSAKPPLDTHSFGDT